MSISSHHIENPKEQDGKSWGGGIFRILPITIENVGCIKKV